MNVTFRKCEHGNWSSHNAELQEDGTWVSTDSCRGGVAFIEDSKNDAAFGIPPFMNVVLDGWQEEAE